MVASGIDTKAAGRHRRQIRAPNSGRKNSIRNVLRDTRNERALFNAGWRVLVVWECETKDMARLDRSLEGRLRRIR